MSARVTQLSYNAGVLSGLMEGRADDPKYQAGLAVCRNAFCTPQGPVQNRAGFMYVNATKYPDKPTRLIPFNYSADQTMVIELGDKYARFHTQGKTLLRTGSERAVLAEGDVPYEIETPWAAEDIFELHYAQSAEVMTLVHPAYPPKEIRRYSLTDWRLVDVVMTQTLMPPSTVNAARNQTADNDPNANKYTQKYVVTALTPERDIESEKSAAASVQANLFATGTTVQVSWSAVGGAGFYRVYKLQGGVYGYIGETTELSIIDDNIAPEVGVTPPLWDEAFNTTKGITGVKVLNGGSGYGLRGPIVGVAPGTFTYQHYHGNSQQVHTIRDSLPPYVDARAGGPYEGIEDAMLAPAYAKAAGTDGYPANALRYPTINTSSGSGGRIELSFFERESGYVAGTKYRYGPETLKLVSSGNYYRPGDTVSARYYAGNKLVYGAEYSYPLVISPNLPVLNVVDETGYGARLEPVVEGGSIKSVRIVFGGVNYTNPRVEVIADEGSGAEITVTVGQTYAYPAAVGYFEQRRVFAGSNIKPQTVWMTATGTNSNMSYHLPLQDDDRISFTVASKDLNQIQHVIPLQQLLLLTSAAEWRVSPLNSDAITPTSISVRPQSYAGASPVQPVMANSTAIYAASRGGHIREISYNYTAGGYISGDLSLRANELFDGRTISDLAYSKEPFPVVWAVSSSGVLLGMTYVPEQSVGAWFEFGTQGTFESVAVVQEGDSDAMYCVVSRQVGGKKVKTVERMERRGRHARNDDIFLDMAGRYEGAPTTTVSGMTWLAGSSVTVNADGVVYDGVKVSEDGVITLPKAASRVTAGLSYSMELQTMPIVMNANDGSLGKGHTKSVNRVWLRLSQSAAPEVGSSFDSMAQQKTRTKEIPGMPPNLIDGVVEVMPPGKWGEDTSVCVRMSKPLPFTLVSHSAEVAVGG